MRVGVLCSVFLSFFFLFPHYQTLFVVFFLYLWVKFGGSESCQKGVLGF